MRMGYRYFFDEIYLGLAPAIASGHWKMCSADRILRSGGDLALVQFGHRRWLRHEGTPPVPPSSGTPICICVLNTQNSVSVFRR